MDASRTCEQCAHYQPTRWARWGRCSVEVPSWVQKKWMVGNAVCSEQDHPNNFAPTCKCFTSKEMLSSVS